MMGRDGVYRLYAEHIRFAITLGMMGCLPPSLFAQSSQPLLFGPKEYRLYQYIYPELSHLGDTSILKTQLYKLYSLNRYYAKLAAGKGWDTLPQVKRDLEVLYEILKARFLADYYRQHISQTAPATEQEALAYYKKNLHLFTIPGKVSYIVVSYSAQSPDGEKRARALLEPYRRSRAQISKVDQGDLILTYEQDIPLQKGYPFYEELRKGQEGQILGPIEKGERRWLFLITELVPDQVRPFESVREVCLQNATQQKRLELLRQEEEEAMKQYPIILSPSWGQGK